MPSTASARRNHTSPRCKSRNVRKSGTRYRRIRTGVRASIRQRYAVNVMASRFAVTVAIVAGAGGLSACATEKNDVARREYNRSVADYQNCIAANQMSTCEAERRIMEANKRVLQRRASQ